MAASKPHDRRGKTQSLPRPRSSTTPAPSDNIALIGVLTGREGLIPTMELMRKQARIQGLVVGSRRDQQDYVAALDASGLRPVIDRVFLPTMAGRPAVRAGRQFRGLPFRKDLRRMVALWRSLDSKCLPDGQRI